MNNKKIAALMIGGQEDGKFIETERKGPRSYIVVAVHEDLPSLVDPMPNPEEMVAFNTQLYTLIRLHDPDGDHWVYQYEGLQCSVIEALIKGYKGQS